jgi:putative transposase
LISGIYFIKLHVIGAPLRLPQVCPAEGYDYSRQGLYFITICLQQRGCLFGTALDHSFILNDAGKMAAKWLYELPEKYPDKLCHDMVVMPNHVHFIIENGANDGEMGNMEGIGTVNMEGAHVGAPLLNARRIFRLKTDFVAHL